MPHSFYPLMNKYREVIDFGSKIDADNYIRAGWELIDTHVEPVQGRGQTILIYRVGWRRDAGQPVEPPKVGHPLDLDPGPSAN
jgi:hypothetical protein